MLSPVVPSTLSALREPTLKTSLLVGRPSTHKTKKHKKLNNNNSGVVHRDLKLENLLLSTAGELHGLKIADFGLARRVGGGGAFGAGAMSTVCGTPQVRGGRRTKRTPGPPRQFKISRSPANAPPNSQNTDHITNHATQQPQPTNQPVRRPRGHRGRPRPRVRAQSGRVVRRRRAVRAAWRLPALLGRVGARAVRAGAAGALHVRRPGLGEREREVRSFWGSLGDLARGEAGEGDCCRRRPFLGVVVSGAHTRSLARSRFLRTKHQKTKKTRQRQGPDPAAPGGRPGETAVGLGGAAAPVDPRGHGRVRAAGGRRRRAVCRGDGGRRRRRLRRPPAFFCFSFFALFVETPCRDRTFFQENNIKTAFQRPRCVLCVARSILSVCRVVQYILAAGGEERDVERRARSGRRGKNGRKREASRIKKKSKSRMNRSFCFGVCRSTERARPRGRGKKTPVGLTRRPIRRPIAVDQSASIDRTDRPTDRPTSPRPNRPDRENQTLLLGSCPVVDAMFLLSASMAPRARGSALAYSAGSPAAPAPPPDPALPRTEGAAAEPGAAP